MTKENWHQVIITVKELDSSAIDLLSYQMFEIGAIGVEVKNAHEYLDNNENHFGELREELPEELRHRDTQIIAYFEEQPIKEKLGQQLSELLADYSFAFSLTHLAHENWEENWRQHYQPQRVTRFMSIVPIWTEYVPAPDERIVYLDPGLAFGTGNHPTTQLGIQALEILMKGGETVLDVGTGSGILAFVAGKFGAQRVIGYDLDPQAIASAQRNLEHQKPALLEQTAFEFHINHLLAGVKEQPDIIVANILPHILVDMFDDAHQLLADNGYLILGGILATKQAEIEEALNPKQWEIIQRTYLGEWMGFSLQKRV